MVVDGVCTSTSIVETCPFLNQRVPAMAPKSKSQFKGSCCRVWITMHTKRGNHDWEWSWCSSSWWFQPIWKILVRLDHFFRDRGEHKKYLSCHHLVMVPGRSWPLQNPCSLCNGFWTLAPWLVQTPHCFRARKCQCANVARAGAREEVAMHTF